MIAGMLASALTNGWFDLIGIGLANSVVVYVYIRLLCVVWV